MTQVLENHGPSNLKQLLACYLLMVHRQHNQYQVASGRQPNQSLPHPCPYPLVQRLIQTSIITAVDAVTTALAGTLTTTASVSKSYQALSSSQSVIASDFSTNSHNVSNHRHLVIAGNHTGIDNVELWISSDDVTFVKMANVSMYPDSNNDVSLMMDAPFSYYKLKYSDAGTATIAGFASD